MAGSRMPEALASLFAVLDEMEIRYFAGGSVASSIHGIARYTQDVDIVADLAPEHMERLASRLVWYKRGGQTSERQWSDVLGIVMSRSLDWDYLRSRAANLGVTDLLEKLFGEARQL